MGCRLKRFGACVSIKRLPQGTDGVKVGLDDFLLSHTVEQFWELPEQTLNLRAQTATCSQADWPDPAPLGDELPAVDDFFCWNFSPPSFRPLVDDVSERMQTPLDYAAVAAGCHARGLREPPRRYHAQNRRFVLVSGP